MTTLREFLQSDPATGLAIGGLALGFLLGVLLQRTGFCAMGGVSDWHTFGDYAAPARLAARRSRGHRRSRDAGSGRPRRSATHDVPQPAPQLERSRPRRPIVRRRHGAGGGMRVAQSRPRRVWRFARACDAHRSGTVLFHRHWRRPRPSAGGPRRSHGDPARDANAESGGPRRIAGLALARGVRHSVCRGDLVSRKRAVPRFPHAHPVRPRRRPRSDGRMGVDRPRLRRNERQAVQSRVALVREAGGRHARLAGPIDRARSPRLRRRECHRRCFSGLLPAASPPAAFT